ncbi:CsbD family protein [Natribacillus halophilus]|uniref:CsbD-like n=1 Tax=Natribacillus halophilus TaxID=549003 RepID=A0A1G8M992_9BACI|nr:CsbD family protein [Natribacillus halophilus]SDI64491.1 CsbD-like [Natribacillus halophilus]
MSKGISEKVKGAVNKVKGESKDQIGNATDNTKLQGEGKKDKAKGAAQDEVGEAKKKEEKK